MVATTSLVASVVFALSGAPATLAQTLCAIEGQCPSESDQLAQEDDDKISLFAAVHRPHDGSSRQSFNMPSMPEGRHEKLSEHYESQKAVEQNGVVDVPATADPEEVRSRVPASDSAPALLCNNVSPNAGSPSMLHIAYACDIHVIEGLKASVASVITSTGSPNMLTIHIIVQEQAAGNIKSEFGISPHCNGIVTRKGVFIEVHAINSKLIEKAVAKVSEEVKKVRGALDTVENFARFYMDVVLGKFIVVYLDTDTIVQSDLNELRIKLLKSNKTAGFVSRGKKDTRMDMFLKNPNQCQSDAKRIQRFMGKPAFNVGVFAVDLKRWAALHYADKVEAWVGAHNRCDGKLWVGGSQPPLLLSFYDLPEGAHEDFILFDKTWNTGDLGWRTNMDISKMRRKSVLHWNGGKKPWLAGGLNVALWRPHSEDFDLLMRP